MKKIVLLLALTLYQISSAMEESPKSIIERKNAEYLAAVGTEDAPPSVQQTLDTVVNLFKARKLLSPSTHVIAKQLNPAMLESLAQQGISVGHNSMTNGEDIIHIGPQHDELTPEQLRSRLAHEVSHIATHQNWWLNPHYYLEKVTYGTSSIVLSWPLWASVFVLAGKHPERIPRRIGYAAAGISASSTTYFYLNSKAVERIDMQTGKTRVEFPCMKKPIEVVCDLTAALVLPHGGSAGKNLYTASLQRNGDRNGLNGDHPWTSTRIKYHTAIEWLQKLQRQKEDPAVK